MPGPGLFGRICRHAGQLAVRNNHVLVGSRDYRLAGGFVVWIVVAGEPVVIRLSLALRPHLVRAFRVPGVGRDERQSLLWRSGIGYHDRQVASRSVWMIQLDVKLLLVFISEFERGAGRELNRAYFHITGIQVDLA